MSLIRPCVFCTVLEICKTPGYVYFAESQGLVKVNHLYIPIHTGLHDLNYRGANKSLARNDNSYVKIKQIKYEMRKKPTRCNN